MAVILASKQQITGLAAAGSAVGGGSWNVDAADVTAAPYNVPSDAEAVIIQFNNTSSSSRHTGLRAEASPTNSDLEWIGDQFDDCACVFLCPISSDGTIDVYIETTDTEVNVIGYMEAGSMAWLDTSLTRTTTTSGATSWDFTSDNASATGIVIQNDTAGGDSAGPLQYATAASPTAFSTAIDPNPDQSGDFVWQGILPLDGSQDVNLSTTSVSTETYRIVAFILQDITILYDDNGGPSETFSTQAYGAATYDYGSEAGLGMFVFDNSVGASTDGFYADDAATQLFTEINNRPENNAVIHPVRSDGTFSYYMESGATSFDGEFIWFIGADSGGGGGTSTPQGIQSLQNQFSGQRSTRLGGELEH